MPKKAKKAKKRTVASKKKVKRKKVNYKQKLERLRKESFPMYTVVRYRWWLLILTLLFTIPHLWIVPFVAAIMGFIKWFEIRDK